LRAECTSEMCRTETPGQMEASLATRLGGVCHCARPVFAGLY
jgi:hypothetical protein